MVQFGSYAIMPLVLLFIHYLLSKILNQFVCLFVSAVLPKSFTYRPWIFVKRTENQQLTPKPFTTAHLKASKRFKPWKLRRVLGHGREVARRKPKYEEEPQKKKNGSSGWELMWLVNMLVQGIVKVVSMIYSVPDWIVSLLASLITSWTGMTLMWYLMEMSTLGSMEACLSYLCEAVITNMMWRTVANTVGVVRLIMKGGDK